MNLYEKIHEIMKDVQYLAKDDSVAFGNTKYKALSEEKVTSIMRAELIRHKLVVFPIQQVSSRNGQISHVDVVYRMVNVEEPGEYIDITSCGDGADSQDKGAGKAMTYAFKYMWLRTFALPTGEDPDKISSAELDEKFRKESAPVCSRCGKKIQDSKNRAGELWPAEQIANFSIARYGKPVCKDCCPEAEAELKAAETHGA